MATKEYVEEVLRSVHPIISLLPPNSKLLFESFAEFDERAGSKPIYYECFLLVQQKETGEVECVKEPLFIEVPEIGEANPVWRIEKIEEWLMSPAKKISNIFGQLFQKAPYEEKITPQHVPSKFKISPVEHTFTILLEKTAK